MALRGEGPLGRRGRLSSAFPQDVRIEIWLGRWGFYLDLREAPADQPLGPLESRTTPPKK